MTADQPINRSLEVSASYLLCRYAPMVSNERNALAKQVQWHWPDLQGEENFVVMFCGFYVEMAAFQSLWMLF